MTSPFGPSGYCPACRFVVTLDPDGMMVRHIRGAVLGQADPCPGSRTEPHRDQPVTSKKSAFKVTVPRAECPQCRRWVPATDRVFGKHNRKGERALCEGSWRQQI